MTVKLTSEQQARVRFLLDEWDSIESFAKTLELVESSSEIHEFAKHYNWDYGLEPLKLVLNHPLCDRGTALEIYWLGQPEYYSGFSTIDDIPSCNRDGYLLLKLIESLLLNEYSFRYNNIHVDPMADYRIENRRCFAKYSGIPDELLLPNFGDAEENKQRLRLYREAPDDAVALDFLANKYLNNCDYIKALECAKNLLLLDPESHRNWYLKISILEKIEKQYESKNLVTQKTNIPLYQDIHQVRQDLVECHQKEIDLYQKNLKSSDPSKFAWKNTIKAQENMANIYLKDKDYLHAIEILEIILEEIEIEPVMGVELNHIVFLLATANQELKNYEKALYYINIYLDKIPEFEYLYFHKLDILRQMGRSEEAEILLEKILETIDNTIEEKQNNGVSESAYFYQKSTLLEKYIEDFRGAADSLQKIIDLQLYYDNENRKKELLERIKILHDKYKTSH